METKERPTCVVCGRQIASVFNIGKDEVVDGEYHVWCDDCAPK